MTPIVPDLPDPAKPKTTRYHAVSVADHDPDGCADCHWLDSIIATAQAEARAEVAALDVDVLAEAIAGQNLYHGRYGTTPAGHATAAAIAYVYAQLLAAAPPATDPEPRERLRDALVTLIRDVIAVDEARFVSGNITPNEWGQLVLDVGVIRLHHPDIAADTPTPDLMALAAASQPSAAGPALDVERLALVLHRLDDGPDGAGYSWSMTGTIEEVAEQIAGEYDAARLDPARDGEGR